jgi:hypothetical protein
MIILKKVEFFTSIIMSDKITKSEVLIRFLDISLNEILKTDPSATELIKQRDEICEEIDSYERIASNLNANTSYRSLNDIPLSVIRDLKSEAEEKIKHINEDISRRAALKVSVIAKIVQKVENKIAFEQLLSVKQSPYTPLDDKRKSM